MVQSLNPRHLEANTLRWLSRCLYLSETVYAIIILGLVSWFLSYYDETPKYPHGTLVYIEIVAGLAIPVGNVLAWVYDCVPKFLMLVNLCFSLAFFAAFGAMNNWDCPKNWTAWRVDVSPNYKPCWRAAEAFCFITAFTYLCSAILSWFTPKGQQEHHLPMYQKRHSVDSSIAPTQQV